MTITPDVEGIANAISARPTRRTVVKGAAWSLPAISTAMAAPAFAASPPTCTDCVGLTGPPKCLVGGTGSGVCKCPPGLICAGTGPLGLLQVCVGTDVLSTCGGTQCYGACVSAGGTVANLITALAVAVGSLVNVVELATLGAAKTCVYTKPLPDNFCGSVTNDGKIGQLCTRMSSCGGGLLGETVNLALGTAAGAYNAVIAALTALGLVARNSCATGYICEPLVSTTIAVDLPATKFAYNVYVGFCQCDNGQTYCHDKTTYPCTLK